MFSLEDRHALVAGAVGPLGRALAVALAEAGAQVSVTTLHADRAEEVRANSILNECWSAGSLGRALTLDLADPAAVEAAVEALERDVAPVDILVNAGHEAVVKPLLEASLEDWERQLASNATSVFVATQAVGRRMRTRGSGRVINVVSVIADRGVPNCALFGASQGAVLAFTRSLAIEWGHGAAGVEQRLTVNAIGVGFIEDLAGPHEDDALRAVLDRHIPVQRLGEPSDLQGALVYLASSAAHFVNGELLLVDGALANHA